MSGVSRIFEIPSKKGTRNAIFNLNEGAPLQPGVRVLTFLASVSYANEDLDIELSDLDCSSGPAMVDYNILKLASVTAGPEQQ